MSRLLPLLAALLLAFPLLAGPVLGPERPLSPVSFGPAFGTQYVQALATDGTDFLAVWSDQTPGRAGAYAAVVNERLEPQHATPLPPLARGAIYSVHAVWTGETYLVIWTDPLQNTSVARVSRDGILLGTPEVFAAAQMPMAVASNGAQALVVLAQGSDLTATLLDSRGRKTKDFIPIPHRGSLTNISAGAADGGFVVVWSEQTSGSTGAVRMMRISESGEAAGPFDLATQVPSWVGMVSVANGSDRVGLAYMRSPVAPDTAGTLVMQTIDPRDGAVSAPVTMAVTTSYLQAVATRDGFAAGYLATEGDGLALVTVDFSGVELERVAISPAPGGDLRLASNGRAVVAIWRDYRLSPPGELSHLQIHGLALDGAASSATSNVTPVAQSAVAQASAAIAPAGEEALVVWTDLTRTMTGDLVAARVDAGGNPIGAPVVLATASSHRWMRPAAVFTGELWLVAWTELRRMGNSQQSYLKIARVGRDGTLRGEPIELAAASGPYLASNGDVTVLACWFEGKSALMRFRRDGQSIDRVPMSGPLPGAVSAIASNGREFLIAVVSGSDWWQFPSPNRRDVQVIRLDASGAPIDAAPIDVAMSPNDEAAPHVVSDGTDFLIVYQHGDTSDASESIRAKRVLRSGVLDGSAPAEPGALIGFGGYPTAAAALRSGYAVAFSSTHSDVATLSLVTVDRTGKPIAEPQPVATSAAEFAGVSLGSSGSTTWLAYGRSAAEVGNIARVFVRRVFESMRRRAAR
ncbi:MAG TPA: hypothetical protein VEU30_12920 [Thermoanaerobaculia bacterium]|nr:hypothetical protein [Thermoanaerobaculia bacterium]